MIISIVLTSVLSGTYRAFLPPVAAAAGRLPDDHWLAAINHRGSRIDRAHLLVRLHVDGLGVMINHVRSVVVNRGAGGFAPVKTGPVAEADTPGLGLGRCGKSCREREGDEDFFH